jgi:DNA-directed RNA polymerase specialized sigma24 family protein
MGASASEIRKLFDRRVLPHLDVLYAVALHFTGSTDRASDSCRATFARAYNLFPTSTAADNWRVRLLKILFGTFNQPLAKSPNGKVSLGGAPGRAAGRTWLDPSSAARKGTAAPARPESSEVQHLLRTLPAEDRAALLLVELAELSYEAAAIVLEVPIETIHSRVSRARLMMLHGLSPAALRSSIQR